MKGYVLIASCFIAIALARPMIKAPLNLVHHDIPHDERVKILQSIFPGNETSTPGYIDFPAMQTNFHFFYWMFESRTKYPAGVEAPTIFWFTGGPGCSSLTALFFENGPYHFKDDTDPSSIYVNPWSWNEKANLVFIDQPVGTGFSYADANVEERDEDEVAADMFLFFQGFYKKHPNLLKSDLYITGESYAGHYIPAISNKIVSENQQNNAGIPLKGIAIGNGLVDSLNQYPEYAKFAHDNKLIGEGTVLVAEAEMVACGAALKSKAYGIAFGLCNIVMSTVLSAAGNINVYDIREQCMVPPLCYQFSAGTTFLNQANVQAALGIPSGIQWEDCNFGVNGAFHKDWMTPMADRLLNVIAANHTVLIYSGTDDFICNYYGGRAWTAALEWPGQSAFNAAKYTQVNLQINGTTYNSGQYKVAKNFAWYEVLNAGHMVPMNQPQASLDMVNTLIAGGWRQ